MSRPVNIAKRTLVVTTVTAAALGGGAALANWLVTGSGPATVEATSVSNLVVTSASPAASLYPMPVGGYPDGTVGAVHAEVDNPNPFPVTVTSATVGTVTSTSPGTCASSEVTTTTGSPIVISIEIPANATNFDVTVPSAVQMSRTAADACQGVGFTVGLSLAGESS